MLAGLSKSCWMIDGWARHTFHKYTVFHRFGVFYQCLGSIHLIIDEYSNAIKFNLVVYFLCSYP